MGASRCGVSSARVERKQFLDGRRADSSRSSGITAPSTRLLGARRGSQSAHTTQTKVEGTEDIVVWPREGEWIAVEAVVSLMVAAASSLYR